MKKYEAFTVMELLTVIAIMVTLIGIGIPAYNSWKNRSQIAKAKATIAKIEMALEMYRTDNGAYPNNPGDLNNGTILNDANLGRYLKINEEDLAGGVINDPWGNNTYEVYVDHDGDPNTIDGARHFRHNRNASYIYSYGPDGLDNTGDDIDNYD